MKIFSLLILLTAPVYAFPELSCGRYLLVGHYSCEASPCLFTIYPKSRSEMIFEVDNEDSYSVKRLTGKNIRASFTLYRMGPGKPKIRFYRQMAMEYPAELGPAAIKLVQKEKCLP